MRAITDRANPKTPRTNVLCLRGLLMAVCFAIGLAGGATLAADNMKAFPPADEGMVRFLFQPPKQDDETAFKLELIVGKTVKTDKPNRYFFGGEIVEETIEGWGFPKYVVKEVGPMAGTLMAVDPDEPKLDRFVTLGGGPFLIRYNSKLPVVVYVPEGFEVRYRVWKAEAETNSMEPG
jgi:ecotin